MKRINITALTLTVFLLLAGCGNISGETPEYTVTDTKLSQNEVIHENTTDNAAETNVLIAYFSRIGNIDSEHEIDAVSSASVVTQGDDLLGNMEYMANLIQNVAGGDIHFIETSEKYPSEYDSSDENALDVQAEKENREHARPDLAATIDNIDTYDIVFLGFPKWYGDMPMPVYSFLDKYDLSGKKIYLFNSSGGGSVANAYSEVSDLEPDAVVEKNIFSVNHSQVAALTEQDIKEWLSEIGFSKADRSWSGWG